MKMKANAEVNAKIVKGATSAHNGSEAIFI